MAISQNQTWKRDQAAQRRIEEEYKCLERATWEAPAIRERRVGDRLSRLIHHAATEVPFYREQWNGTRIRANGNGFEFLKEVPIITKDDLIAVSPKGCLAGNLPASRRQLVGTSGSTGRPFKIYRDLEKMPVRIACRHLALHWAGVHPDDRYVWVGASFREKERNWRAFQKWVKVALGKEPPRLISIIDLTVKNMHRTVRRLARPGLPYFLEGYTSGLLFMAREMKRQGLEIAYPPRCVIATAETMTPADRDIIEQAFGVPTSNRYASWEFGTVAQTCPDVPEKMHLNAEWFVCEILRKDGQPAKPGEMGRLVVTDLTNEVMPFIRYDTDDVVTVSEPCPCGRTWPTLTHIEGRTSDFIQTRSGRTISSSMIPYILETKQVYPYLSIYQTRKIGNAHIEFIYVPAPEWTEAIGESIAQAIQDFFGREFTVSVKTVSDIPRESSGKYRPVKSFEVNGCQ